MPKKIPPEGFNPHFEAIGCVFTEIGKGYSQCILDVSENHFNPHKVVHGGVMYSMADTGMGGALYTLIAQSELCATIEVKINYFKAVRAGKLICDTKVIHKGKRSAVMESEIKNNEILVAKAIGTYSIFEGKRKEV